MNSVHTRWGVIISKLLNNPKELILSVAKDIAYTEGLSTISMRKVAVKCEIGLGTIYNYYPTKMDIIIAIIEDFWKDCLSSFHSKNTTNLNFFEEIEFFYFHTLGYLEQFQTNWLKELASFSSTNKVKGKQRESEFIGRLSIVFKMILDKHQDEFNQYAFDVINKDQVATFILDYLFIMLRKSEKDYTFFDFTLKKLLL